MEILLQNGKWFPVASIGSPGLDGRIIDETAAQEIISNFKTSQFVPYIAIGHDGAYGSGKEARVGSIKDIRITDTETGKVLEVLPYNLSKDLMKVLQQGSYPHVSVEIGFTIHRDREKEPTAMLYGFAVLGRKAPAFPDFRTVAFNADSSQIYLYKTGGKNMPEKEKQENTTTSDTQSTTTKEIQTTQKEDIKGEKLQDITEQTFEQLQTKNNTLENEKKFLESKIDEYKQESENYKAKLSDYETKIAKLEFRNFYNKHVQRGVLLNKDLKFKTEDTSDIFNTEMFEHWKKLDENGRQELDEHYNFKTSIIKEQPNFAKTQVRPEAEHKSKDELVTEKMRELAKADGTDISIGSKGNYGHYLQRATKILGGM